MNVIFQPPLVTVCHYFHTLIAGDVLVERHDRLNQKIGKLGGNLDA